MPSKFKRPIGITLFAIAFLWIGCCGAVFLPIIDGFGATSIMWREIAGSMMHSEAALKVSSYLFFSVLYLLYIAYVIIGFGLWKLRNCARKAALVVNLIGVLVSLTVLPFFVRPVAMAIAVVIGTAVPFAWFIWYLKRPRVCFAFGACPSTNSSTSTSEPPPGLSKVGKAWVVVCIVATFAVYCGTLTVGVDSKIRSTSIYKMALNEAQHSPCAASLLGTPLTGRWGTSGNWSEGGQDDSANLSIPVYGPKGKGKLEMLAEKRSGAWKITSLVLVRESRRIQLIPAASNCP